MLSLIWTHKITIFHGYFAVHEIEPTLQSFYSKPGVSQLQDYSNFPIPNQFSTISNVVAMEMSSVSDVNDTISIVYNKLVIVIDCILVP